MRAFAIIFILFFIISGCKNNKLITQDADQFLIDISDKSGSTCERDNTDIADNAFTPDDDIAEILDLPENDDYIADNNIDETGFVPDEGDIVTPDDPCNTYLPGGPQQAVTFITPAMGQKIAAIGDIHGDIIALRSALVLAGVIDEKDRWIGGDTIVVQTGDYVDRGDDDKAIFDLFDRLKPDAENFGGRLFTLNGNHELMNAHGNTAYASAKSLSDFENDCGDTRISAFRPGGPYALRLAGNSTALVIGNNVFVHGGITPDEANIGIERLNTEISEWLLGYLPELSWDAENMTWVRTYSQYTDEAGCEMLAKTLALLGAERMIVGHTVQSTINSACSGMVWRIDTGMSRFYYGGPVEILVIEDENIKILTQS